MPASSSRRPARRRRAGRRSLLIEYLEPRRLLAGTVQGMVFDDLDADGVFEPGSGETPVPNAIVYIDLNHDGVLGSVHVAVEPDRFTDRAVLNNRVPDFTLSGRNKTNTARFDITANESGIRSTGTKVFGHANVDFFNDDRRLRVDFHHPGRSISIDFIGSSQSSDEVGRLEIYDAANNLLDSYTTAGLRRNQVETMTLARREGDIAYALAYTSTGSFGRLDNLRLNHLGPDREPSARTDVDGRYSLTGIPAGVFSIRKVVPPGEWQTSPTTDQGPNTLVPLSNRTDHVFDAQRGIQYVGTSDGTIERFDLGTRKLLHPLHVGGNISSLDLSADNRFLYVGDANTAPETGMLRRIDLTNNTKRNVPYELLTPNQAGVKDLALLNNGKGLFSIQFNGSSTVPLWQVDLGTHTTSTILPSVEQHTVIQRAGDRSLAILHGSNSHPNAIRTYDPGSDSFPASRNFGNVIGAFSAVNRDGTQIAFRSQSDGLLILDRDLATLHTLPHLTGGAVFDPVRDLLYVVDATADQIVVFRTDTYQETHRLEIGEDIKDYSTLNPTVLSTSPDGRFLFLNTPLGVRLFELKAATGHVVRFTGDESYTGRDFGCRADPYANQEAATISGVKWEDTNGDGRRSSGEEGLEGFRIYLDLNENGTWDRAATGVGVGTVVEPDAFPPEWVLNRHFPGVVLMTADQNNVPRFKVTVNRDRLASTGHHVFGEANVPFWNSTRRLRMDFRVPTRYVAIDFIGSSISRPEFGRLDIYDRNDNLLARYDTQGMLAGNVERMSLTRDNEDIAYAVAYSPAGQGNFARLDNLRFAGDAAQDEPSRVTDANGRYAFDKVAPGHYRVAEVQQPGWQQTYPLAASATGTVIDVPNRVEHEFDGSRGILFISTSDGKIERFDLASGQKLTAFNVGSVLSGLDIAPAADVLYVGDERTGGGLGVIYKVDLDSGAGKDITYPVSGQQGGVKDVSIGSQGKALFSILFQGSGAVPLFDLDLASGQVSERLGSVEQHTLFSRSGDRNLILLHGSNSHPVEIRTWDAVNDSFSPGKKVGNVIGANSAVNADGSLIAFRSTNSGLSLLDRDLEAVEILQDLRGGVIFDPLRSRLFGVDSERNELVVYDLGTTRRVFRLPISEDIKAFSTLNRTDLSITPDGSRLFLSTPGGIRLFEVDTPGSHWVGLGYGDAASDLDFGNRADGANRPPKAVDDVYRTDEDQELVVNAPGVLTNDSDPDGDALKAVLRRDVANGTLTLNPDGSFRYTPDDDFVGRDSFQYVANDGALDSDVATVTIFVDSQNDAPELFAAGPSADGNEDAALLVSLRSFINGVAGTTRITDADPGDVVGGIAVIGSTGRGDWEYTLDGLNFSPLGDVSEASARLLSPEAGLLYTPDTHNGEEATATFRAWDATTGTAGETGDTRSNGGSTAYSVAVDTLTLKIADINDAPVLTPAGPETTTDEDTPLVLPLSDFINAGNGTTGITDVDTADPVGGIAVTALNGPGFMEYSLNGTDFLQAPAVSPSSALLLDKDARIRYTPVGDGPETASMTYRAWDTTTGTAGQTGDTTANGGTTPFSTAIDTATLHVTSLNDAPELTPAGPSVAGDEDTTLTVSVLTFVNQGVGTTTITDKDAGAIVGGIAVIGAAGAGSLQFSLDGQTYDDAAGTTVSFALLLPHDAFLRYLPDMKNGESVPVTFRAWDTTTGTAGERADTSANGGTTAFSSATDVLTLEIQDVNDAPVLTPAGPLRSTDEDTPLRLTISDFVNGGQSTTTVTDVDADDPAGPIAVTESTGRGTWNFSLDGVTFQPLPDVSDAEALLLPHDAVVEYVPDTQNGETAELEFRAWDQSSGQAGTQHDASTAGGTSPFSESRDTLMLTVDDVNDAPVLLPAAPGLATDEETPVDSRLLNLINQGLGTATVTDADEGAEVGAVAVIGTTGKGTFRYSLNGADFVDVGAVAVNSALLLPADAFLRYVPDAKNGETATISYRAWDRTQGQDEQRVDTSLHGGTTPFSIQSDTLSITVSPVNDAPELAPAGPQLSTDEDTPITRSLSQIINRSGGTQVTDVDEGAIVGGIAVMAIIGRGTWSYTLNGSDFFDVGTVGETSALLLSPDAGFRYTPDTMQGETATIEYRAWDRTSGAPGNRVDASQHGGSTAFSSLTDTLSIVVSDVNDPPTDIGLDHLAVSENAPGAVVGNLTVVDPDPQDTHTWTVSDVRFEAVAGQLKLKDGVSLNHEEAAQVVLTIKATDSGNPPLDREEEYTLQVLDVNDPPTVPNPQADQIARAKVPFEYTVPSDTFDDEDGDALTLAASLVGGGSLPIWLSFASSTARFSGTPSDADIGTLQIEVKATDDGTPPLNVVDTFELDVQENLFPWQNPRNPLDVDDNGRVEPLDALILINYKNANPGSSALPDPPQTPPPYLDPSGDNLSTPLDSLLVINFLNAEGEGESVQAAPLAVSVGGPQDPAAGATSGHLLSQAGIGVETPAWRHAPRVGESELDDDEDPRLDELLEDLASERLDEVLRFVDGD